MRKIFCLFDTETTGLTVHPQAALSKQPRPIEFAALITDGDNIISEHEFIINPEIAIEEVITRITGLTNEDLECNPTFENFIPKIAEIFKQVDVTVAHNHSFDKAILKYAMERENLTLDDINFPKVNLCTVEETYHKYGRRVKLSDLYNWLCGPYEQKHRALDDVKLLHEICKEIGLYDAFK